MDGPNRETVLKVWVVNQVPWCCFNKLLLTWVNVVRCLRLAGVGHVAVVGVCPE